MSVNFRSQPSKVFLAKAWGRLYARGDRCWFSRTTYSRGVSYLLFHSSFSRYSGRLLPFFKCAMAFSATGACLGGRQFLMMKS